MILGPSGHERVLFAQDAASGLRTIVAMYSTARGPALGGTRYLAYTSEEAALADVLDLSRAMAYKNAMAGLDHGGGKAVILADPEVGKTPELLRAYGRVVESLGGAYVTACDVGTYVADMDIVAETCQYVTGRSPEAGGAGDSSVLTAFGVYRAMCAAARELWGADDLAGRTIGIVGVGKVGRRLVEHAERDGATVVVADVDRGAIDRLRGEHPGVTVLDDAEAVMTADVDIVAPCALGGAIHSGNVESIRCPVICGGANNQLAEPGLADRLDERGILYCPDYVVNSGGVIQVADERLPGGFDLDRATAKTAAIFDTVCDVLQRARAEGATPAAAAAVIAEQRMAVR